ncbi:amidohydrolase family protein [Thalassotalea psychrophila]|uniref:Amidohydrolase family protein n=1 Tax=Thalassotalea psychrophila TaxID=3065647 RepID=A0ABY9TYR9_9GAMM|nr:amidohydrolase family protein [Colwelliaceae bacterium SQ149]
MSKFKLSLIASALITLVACADSTNNSSLVADVNQGNNCKFESSPSNIQFDSVIVNGRVMDPGCGFDDIRNIGIKDGKIVAITKDSIIADKIIDASGKVVAPGFIDFHIHTNTEFGFNLLMRDGVTTALELEGGTYPLKGWLADKSEKTPVNYGASVAHSGIRAAVLDGYVHPDGNLIEATLGGDLAKNFQWSVKVSNTEERQQIVELIDNQLQQGAIGLGITVGYYSNGASSPEIYDVIKATGKYELPSFVHARFSGQKPPTSGYMSLAEVISAGAISNSPMVLQHFHNQTLSETRDAIQMFEDANANGIKVIGEVYPYNFGNTFMFADFLQPENYGPGFGRSYEDIIHPDGSRMTKESFDALLKKAPQTPVIFYGAQEADMNYAVSHPSVIIGSDAGPLFDMTTGKFAAADADPKNVKGHPRSAGSHAKVLRMAREQKLMPLMLAISKMSYMQAQFLATSGISSMHNKGKVQLGTDADLIVFDANTVTDNADENYAAFATTGITDMLVNGVQTVKNEQVISGVNPGQPVFSDLKK